MALIMRKGERESLFFFFLVLATFLWFGAHFVAQVNKVKEPTIFHRTYKKSVLSRAERVEVEKLLHRLTERKINQITWNPLALLQNVP